MLVRGLNIPHTHRVAGLLEENFPVLQGKVLVIHSEHEQYDLAGRASALLSRFFSGECWVIVHCGMLGVGFDHKWISVSCNLCVLKSMSPAEQEWGRSLRKVPGPAPGAVWPAAGSRPAHLRCRCRPGAAGRTSARPARAGTAG